METRSNYIMVGAVTVALLIGTLLFIVWLAGLSSKSTKCYDIYFPAVGGINKGSNVSFSGVPVGQVSKISLLPNRPEFVWVRIDVDQQTPVLEGTTAEIHSISLAGANEIQLNGAERGRPPITQMGPQGCPVIPASASGLSALLNSAPELLARIQRLTERLTELLNDKNQNAISDILENIDATTGVIRKNAPEMAATLQEARIAAHNAAIAANNIAALSNNANSLVNWSGPRGGHEPQPGDHLGAPGGGQPQRDGRRRSARRPELQQIDPAGSQPARARHARADAVAPAGIGSHQSTGHRRRDRPAEAA